MQLYSDIGRKMLAHLTFTILRAREMMYLTPMTELITAVTIAQQYLNKIPS
ncbi:hypothetical protein WUBG_13174 [Wuchereria bancrofti]|uniref:Uncharacterized protein n=1 Tax=Wuchereria bancrofti TaxID=6293 RepID=J9E1A2_WUCBA|nr:hypothetical protein WUBG_13174 [Wuchereria bancrofti]